MISIHTNPRVLFAVAFLVVFGTAQAAEKPIGSAPKPRIVKVSGATMVTANGHFVRGRTNGQGSDHAWSAVRAKLPRVR